MAESTPILPDAHIVRTYSEYYVTSDPESEGDARHEVDEEDEDRQDISIKLEQKQLFMDKQIRRTLCLDLGASKLECK